MFPSTDETEFIRPPEAPVFEPDEEEWKDPLGYIAKIHPYAVKVGICKIRPPPDWQPTFSVDIDKFRFTPRIQKLHELEAKTRVKLNFIDAIAKFWELQGSFVKVPNVEKKSLDLHELHKIVQAEGGYEDVTRLRRWSRVALLMGYSGTQSSAVLRRHYEKILYPYDVFMSGAMTGESVESNSVLETENLVKGDVDNDDDDDGGSLSDNSVEYAPPSYNARYETRRSKYKADSTGADREVNYENNPELKKLQFLAPGPKITGSKPSGRMKKRSRKYEDHYVDDSELDAIQGKKRTNSSTADKNIFSVVASWDIQDYKCRVCESGTDEDCMLLCDACDSSYHTYCLIPPLRTVPPGDWRCPKCVAKECNKPTETYGFEQAKKLYSLHDFGVMANKFKENYFSMPPHEVPSSIVEREFWRLVQSMDDDVCVEYGADLHTKDLGSGFPVQNNCGPEDEVYINSPWNLNNMANNEKSVLKYITQDISGMKVPWLYIGMCFSSFCWHTEDHWSYSINYCHWGEPKTWYGVPESEADKLERCVQSVAPELFEKSPDLFHHLVTTCSPMTLMNYGVSVVRTDQHAGEFVVTFPRAYHAGFNQGYNCAEAVNFCPADWLSMGAKCIDHYRKLQRAVVFSHEELVCKMATMPDTLDLDLAKKLYDNMKHLVDMEIADRNALNQKGIKDKELVSFELIQDDERQCHFCKGTLFFSCVACLCDKKRMACLKHADELCVCQNFKKHIKYRYTLVELPQMLTDLKRRADSFNNWEKKVQKVLSCSSAERLDISAFKELIAESDNSQFPDCELYEQLKSTVLEAEQCAQVANQLIAKKHKTRKTSVSPAPSSPHLTFDELKDFVMQVKNLPCVIKEAKAIDILMTQIENFRFEARLVLGSEDYNEKKVTELIEHAETMDVELPEMHQLKMDLKASKWLDRIIAVLNQADPISLDVIRSCVDQGIGLKKKQASAEPLSRLKELLYAADRWEEKAKICLQAKPRHMIGTLEVIVQEASKVKIVLPNVSALKEALCKAKDWMTKVEAIQNDEYYPYYDMLEGLVTSGRPIPVRLEQLAQMESQVASARSWRERTTRTFLKKGSTKQLVEVLRPRTDVGLFEQKCKKKKKEKCQEANEDAKPKKHDKKVKMEKMSEVKEERDIKTEEFELRAPHAVSEALKRAAEEEMETLRALRIRNKEKLSSENIEGPYCLCRKPIDGLMIRCNLCLEWFHNSCVVMPKTVHGKPIGKCYDACSAAREAKYLCPACTRTRRPRLDTILALLMLLQKLPVRLCEGEALQFLTERAMNWQDRVKQLLAHSEIQRVLGELKTDLDSTEKQSVLLVQKLLSVQKINRTLGDRKIDVKAETNESASLECTEEMGGSPVSKDNKFITNPETVHLQSGGSSRSQSPIDVCTPLVTMQELPDELLDEAEEIMFEGDVLEVSLDETSILWALLQTQRPLLKEQCMVMSADYRRKLIKARKKQRKRKHLDSSTVVHTKTEVIFDVSAVKKLKEVAAKLNIKKEEVGMEEDQDEDDCSAKPCLKPLGEEVEWVQCDSCESWYHCACVKITAEEANSADEYKCPYCYRQKTLPDLNVIAQVAYEMNEEKTMTPLDSLICLADVSEKMVCGDTINTRNQVISDEMATDSSSRT